MPKNRRDFFLGLAALVAIVATAAPGYDSVAQRMDDGALLVYPELILKGWLPYQDFETYYGPANAYLLAGVYALFHPGVMVERTVGMFYHLAVLGAVFCLVRPRGILLALGSVLITHLFLLPTGLAPFGWLGGLSCALWSLYLMAAARSRMQVVGAGLLAAAALLYRPDLTPAVVISAGLLLFFQPSRIRLPYLIGIGAGLLPMVFLSYAAGFQNVFENLFLYPVVITNPGRKLPWSVVQPYLIYLLVLHLLASAANVWGGLLALRQDKGNWANRLFVAVAFFAFGTSHQVFQRMDSGHVTLCCFLSLALLPVSLSIISERWIPRTASRSRPLLLVAVTLLAVAGLAPELVHQIRQNLGRGGRSAKDDVVFVEHQGRSFPVDSPSTARETGALLDKITSLATRGQRLFVGPADLRRTNYDDTFLYHLLPQLTPATYFLEMNPLSANRPDSRLSADLMTADWLILDRRLDEWNEPNDSMRFGPEAPNLVVQTKFELSKRIGSYDLYRRK
ncbi:MAG: hypothetical protein M3N12_02245 [Verrucomicrobiota bacterium]|nr:hypothetical protein [Verrucomicrobiota bacterium]